MFLKQSTSAVVLVGPVLDASGVAVTTAVIGDFTLSKNGTSAAMSGNTISHSHNGHYAITLTTANTDTIGRLTISVNNTAQAMPVFRWDICQPTVYDALFTNATNTTGGLPAATGAISALAGAVSTLTAVGVRTELATELGRIDTTVGSRLATVGYTAPPSAVNNATAVRSELAVELGRIDVTVSSRLATASYTAPLSASETRSAVGLASANLDTQLADLPTVAEFEARTLAAAGYASSTHWTATRAGYLDGVLIAANYNQRTVQVTGSNHVAADIHELQPAVITDAAFAAGWLTAAGTAADYITELQTALGTATNQTAILDRVSFALSALAGNCSTAQTATETYVLSIGGNTYTAAYSGLDGSGNRSTTTLTKA
jgi:hypothetical protein